MRSLGFAGTILAATLLCNCFAPLKPVQVFGDMQPGKPTIAVVDSGRVTMADKTMESLVVNSVYPILEYRLVDATQSLLSAAIKETKPAVIVALGAKAASWAADHFPEIPQIQALVLKPSTQRLNHPVGRIEFELSPATEFSMYRLVLPRLTRVVSFYSRGYPKVNIQRIADELRTLGIELTAVQVSSAEGLIDAYDRNKDAGEALWLLNDPVLLSSKIFKDLNARAIHDGKPILCSTLREFAGAGAMMVVALDFTNIGSQIADMANAVVKEGPSVDTLTVRPPVGGQLVLNLDVATKLGIDVPRSTQPFINEIISSR